MIPKSVIETTINILEGGLDAINEILESNRKQDIKTIKVYSMIKTFEPQVAVYELLISEHKKYLEENYGDCISEYICTPLNYFNSRETDEAPRETDETPRCVTEWD